MFSFVVSSNDWSVESSAKPMMEFSGVRNSWLSWERNSVFA